MVPTTVEPTVATVEAAMSAIDATVMAVTAAMIADRVMIGMVVMIVMVLRPTSHGRINRSGIASRSTMSRFA